MGINVALVDERVADTGDRQIRVDCDQSLRMYLGMLVNGLLRSVMRIEVVYEFPPFDTGLFQAAEFLIASGNARLIIRVAEHSDIILQFQRVRWHEFTALYNCSAEQVKSAYFRLVRLDESEHLTNYIKADRAPAKAYKELHHFRVFVDEHGCHELLAQSFSAVPDSGQWRQAG